MVSRKDLVYLDNNRQLSRNSNRLVYRCVGNSGGENRMKEYLMFFTAIAIQTLTHNCIGRYSKCEIGKEISQCVTSESLFKPTSETLLIKQLPKEIK